MWLFHHAIFVWICAFCVLPVTDAMNSGYMNMIIKWIHDVNVIFVIVASSTENFCSWDLSTQYNTAWIQRKPSNKTHLPIDHWPDQPQTTISLHRKVIKICNNPPGMRRHMVTFVEEALARGTEWRSGLQWILQQSTAQGFPGLCWTLPCEPPVV